MSNGITLSAELRHVYMVLSPRALPYAGSCIESLLRNSAQTLHLHLITDGREDKITLLEAMERIKFRRQHRWDVSAEGELSDREADMFHGFGNLRAFRHGHPCWRKITDPLLIGEPGAELIMLDPDVYFPNRFDFEATPESGLLLMYQKPNCLLPPEIVQRAFDQRIPLADHVDIGVAHWRAGRDLEWIDWLIGKLGGESLPRVMHIEAIIWAAIAIREGGGHLNPSRWVCWHRTQVIRVKQKLGVPGNQILRGERWEDMKCLHCGGASKWWLTNLSGDLLRRRRDQLEPSRIISFRSYEREKFAMTQRARRMLRSLGYYKVLGSS